MRKILLWGAGRVCDYFSKKIKQFYENEISIVGITDSYRTHEDMVSKRDYIDLISFKETEFDDVVVTVGSYDTFLRIKKFIEDITEGINSIHWYKDYEGELRRQRIIKKYKGVDGMEETLEWISRNGLSTRNQFQNQKKIIYEMHLDKMNGYPYIVFEDKKVYYPREYWIEKPENERHIVNFEEDNQYPGSPHLYTYEGHDIHEGDCIVDAGACEGNFSIKYIEKVKTVYLIEPDTKWRKPLELTFTPWKEKCRFIWRGLSDHSGDESIDLDTIFQNELKPDFIKMDIEGAECRALLGGLDVIKNAHPTMSVCSYHRKNDERNIRFILEALGYKTHISNGTMFYADKDIDWSLDFRKGMVYADWGDN
ncbi:FkbM family methyltransferase [Butyrivibrio sp. AE2015]|uniref:FkbM family methyltransferase n=1 Tax=Butyrivibrio sp. AE2015 TaxID=1280663 RepID=UPI0003B33CA0|nr:FkbM family methyltransferase [Butyrivibrio sp. AE2015]